MKSTKLIRVKEAAKRLGISIPTLYRHVKKPDFPARVYIGRAVGFKESDIESYIEEHTETKERVSEK